ncbi:hypothetical protein LTR08_002837 [Meristemomyces frigidus]|nr:hypothetical protein LTR08_002837 [Meristemomyces frigidus]
MAASGAPRAQKLITCAGRLALPKPTAPLRPCRRALATEATHQQNPADAILDSAISASGTTDSGTTAPPAPHAAPRAPSAAANDRLRQDWLFHRHQNALLSPLGTTIAPHYQPHTLLSHPPAPKDITLELLLASQAHIGHATSLWNPANAKYIFGVRGERDPIHIISLDVTAAHLRRACKIVRGVTERGGLVLFVGSREGQARAVVKAAQMAQGCHLFSKWIPGSITNGQQILGKCRTRVVDEHDNEVAGFADQLLQKAALKPDLVVCLNPLENYVLLHECGLNNIPTIGIIDTDANPTWVTYPIPANDDSLRSVQVIAGVLGRAGQEGQAVRKAKAKRGIVDYRQNHGLQPPSDEDEEAKEKAEKDQSLLAAADAFDVDLDVEDEVFPPDSAHATTGLGEGSAFGELDPSLSSESSGEELEEGFLPYEQRNNSLGGGELEGQQLEPQFAGNGDEERGADGEGEAWREKSGDER